MYEEVNIIVDLLTVEKSMINCLMKKRKLGDIPGGPVVKTPSANAGGVSSIPGRGAKIPHMPRQK